MVSNPIQLPKFPASSPDQLTRKQGVHYAERVLRQLDQEREGLSERLEALLWAMDEMRRVRDGVAIEHGEKGASFFEGVINRLHPASIDLKHHISKAGENRRLAEHCRIKAKADFDKLMAYAETLEGSARKHEAHQCHDSRFA